MVALATFGGGPIPIVAGTKTRVATFANQSWSDSQLTLANQPSCAANGTDKAANSADARQWMFDHKTWIDSTTLPDALKKVMFMRAGEKWKMDLLFNITGPANLDIVQLAFRDNAGTRGDYAGTYPVIHWTSTGAGYTGAVSLSVHLKQLGRYNVVLYAKSKPWAPPPPPGGQPVYQETYSMTEMEWIVVE